MNTFAIVAEVKRRIAERQQQYSNGGAVGDEYDRLVAQESELHDLQQWIEANLPQMLTRTQVLGLLTGQHLVNVRLLRLTMPNPTLVYEGPARLHVTKLNASRKNPKRRLYTLDGIAFPWAEYLSDVDLQDDGRLLAEDWLCEVYPWQNVQEVTK